MLNKKKSKRDNTKGLKTTAEKVNESISMAIEEGRELFVDELTPAEELSCKITGHLAFMAAERFTGVVDVMGMEAAKKFVVRVESSEAKVAVSMLQALFLSHGMIHAAEELDILKYCKEYDGDAYAIFISDLFNTDIFDWFALKNLFDESKNEDAEKQHDQEVGIWQIL